MDSLLDAERRLRRLACPLCGRSGSLHQTMIRCELACGEYRYTVRCQGCGIVFELRTATERPRVRQPDRHAWLFRLVCPACGGAGGEISFRCDVPSRSCFYLVQCLSCGHEYAEQGPSGERGDSGEMS